MAEAIFATPFYFVRPTECGAGEPGEDPGLTPEGLRQARKLARRFAKNPFGIRGIFCSPRLRAIQMADVIHDVLPVKLRVLGGLAESGDPQAVGEALGSALAGKQPILIVSHGPVAAVVRERLGLAPQPVEKGEICLFEPRPGGAGWECRAV